MSVVSRLVRGSAPGTRTPLSVLLPPYHASHGSCDTICLLCKGPPSTSRPSGSLCAHCLCQLRLQGEASLTILSTCPQKVPPGGVPPTHPEASQCNRKREAGTGTFLQKWPLHAWIGTRVNSFSFLEHSCPLFILPGFLAEVSGRPLSFRSPLLLLRMRRRGCYKEWSLFNHENSQFSGDSALAPRWAGLFVSALSTGTQPHAWAFRKASHSSPSLCP